VLIVPLHDIGIFVIAFKVTWWLQQMLQATWHSPIDSQYPP